MSLTEVDGVLKAGVPNTVLIAVLESLGSRFAGVDITFRRFAPPEWMRAYHQTPYVPHTGQVWWRVRLITNKNQRDEYRITRYGHTFEDAALRLIDKVRDLDGRQTVEPTEDSVLR